MQYRELRYDKWVKYIHDYQLNKYIKVDSTLYNFLIDDLKKLEDNVNELIENVYASGKEEQFADDIENIDNFFSYWEHHIKGLITKIK
jgi:hypothetical protein